MLRLSKYELGERAEQPNPKPVIPSAAEESKIPGPKQASPVPTLNMNNKSPVPSNSAAPRPQPTHPTQARPDRNAAMLRLPIFALRYVLWALGNLRQRLKRPRDYVAFILEGEFPELKAPRPGWLRRRLLPSPQASLQELGEQFKALQQDHRVKGVVLHLAKLELAPAQAQTLREFIANLRSAGKRVVTWATGYDNTAYYVASAADEILLQTGGEAGPLGLHGAAIFLGDALQRVGVQADFIQISPYKTAADPLMRSSMSDEAREMSDWLGDSYFEEFVAAIAAGRGIDETAARSLVDGAPYTDLRAVESSVVDGLVSEEDLPEYLGAKLRTDGKPARLATWDDAKSKLLRPPPAPGGRYVALIRIEGAIVDGRSRQPPLKSPLPAPILFNKRAGDLSVVQQARRVLADTRAAAVVLYVDSPGGSASASEAMASALQRLAAQKPMVAVMGPVAASGGYYVSTPARWIFARPGSVTGSIGVLAGKMVLSGLLDKLLLGREAINRGLHADLEASDRPFDDAERKVMLDSIQRAYDVFLDRVATSRSLSRDDADAVGGGRVWTGSQALEKGLVDELGGLESGLAKARQLAGLHPRARVREAPAHRGSDQPPLPSAPASIVNYALDGLRLLGGGKTLYLCGLAGIDGRAGE